MSDTSDKSNQPFVVAVGSDRLKAVVRVSEAVRNGSGATVDQIIAALEAAQVAVDDAVRARAEQLAALCTAAVGQPEAEVPELFLVAQGRAPTDATDGDFEWAPELADKLATPGPGDRIDYFAQNSIITVAAGVTIGRVIAPRDGRPGRDVFGAEIAPSKPKGEPLRLGANVKPSDSSPDEIVSESDGRVLHQNGEVQVSEVLAISGDIDFDSGSIDACVDVIVHGTVRANFKVHTTKSLSVDKVVEAADVHVGGDLVVRGGIFGQEQAGGTRVGGNVVVQLLSEADVRVGGDLRFNKEALNSHTHVIGRVIAERGTIIGGETYGREGIEVRTVGSEAQVATSIATGIEVNTLRRVRRAEKDVRQMEKSAGQIRQAVQPLMANMKRLLPAQRERATELLCKADEIEMQVTDTQEESERQLRAASPQGSACILVSDVLYTGTHIVIDGRDIRLRNDLHGPVKIEIRKVENVTEMVAVNQRTGSITVLPTTGVDLDSPPTDESDKSETNYGTKQPAANDRTA